MKRLSVILFIAMCLGLSIPAAVAQDKMWVSSERATLKADKKASSETISTVPIGTEVTVLTADERWYRIRTSSGEEGWMYGGRLSKSPPEKETREQSGNLFTSMSGSRIGADEADTSRSIRGLSPETEQYASNRGTPASYRRALDRVLSMGVTEREVETFLEKGKIGEYAP